MDLHFAYGELFFFFLCPPPPGPLRLNEHLFHDVLKLFLVQVLCIDCGKLQQTTR